MTDIVTEAEMDAKIDELLADWRRRYRPLLGPWRVKPLRWMTTVAVEWKPQDAWIGCFWKRTEFATFHSIDVWICFVPCIPIHIWRHWRPKS